MKNINKIYKKCWALLLLTGFVALALNFSSCDDNSKGGSNTPMVINNVYLEDASSSVTDRLVTFGRLGQTVRLEGSGFNGVQKVYFNGVASTFNTALMTDNNLWVQIPSKDVPIIDAAPDVHNTIILEKGDTKYSYAFEIMAAAPTITNISHSMPQAGDVITLTGTNLQGITQVTFPGNLPGTNITSDDENGTWCQVTVPNIGDNSGSILVVGANGGTYSQACFNYKKGLFHNFDDVQNFNWGQGVDNTALTDVVPATTPLPNEPKSQGGYQVFNASANLAANDVQKFWLNTAPIVSAMSTLPASLTTDQCGIQMDIYVDGAWNSGLIRYVMADGYGNDKYCMLYQPIYPNGTAMDASLFVNPGCWFTITLPFSLSADFVGKTLGDVIAQMNQAKYLQTGPFLENSGIKNGDAVVFAPVTATEKIYFDNIRIVPLTTPTYSDFPDE